MISNDVETINIVATMDDNNYDTVTLVVNVKEDTDYTVDNSYTDNNSDDDDDDEDGDEIDNSNGQEQIKCYLI